MRLTLDLMRWILNAVRFLERFLLVSCLLVSYPASAQSIFTIAGGGTEEGRPATVAALNEPVSLALDSAGNLHIGERGNYQVRKIATATGIITLVAGNRLQGFAGDGGPAKEAKLTTPAALAVDPSGKLLIVDRENHRIRSVHPATGIITSVAGSGASGFSGDGGPATAAALNFPEGLAVDRSGNVFIADWFNGRVRKVDARTGIITTVAGSGSSTFSGDGGPATAAGLEPNRVAVDAEGNLYIAETLGYRVRKVEARTGLIATVAGNGSSGSSGDGGPATAAQLNLPNGVAVDEDGNIYIADSSNQRIRRVSAESGVISTFAAGFRYPIDLAVDPGGNVYVADSTDHRVRRIDGGTRTVTTIGGNGQTAFRGDGGPATAAALDSPLDLAIDSAGNLFIAESGRIRKLATNGTITTAAVVSGSNVAVDLAGNIYVADFDRDIVLKLPVESNRFVTVAGTGLAGFSGDGGPATAARLYHPNQVTVDASGTLFIADFENDRIRKVDAGTGIIMTVAGSGTSGFSGDGGPATAAALSGPRDVVLDAAGSLYVADSHNARIRKVTAATGLISTVAGNGRLDFSGDGGPAAAAGICCLLQVSVDMSGNIYIPDHLHDRVRRVDTSSGIINTIAGVGRSGYSGDHGPASAAQLDYPSSVAVDRTGDIYIADSFNERIRRIPPCGSVAVPVLSSPSNGSTGVSQGPRLAWRPATNAQRYDIYLDTGSPPKKIVASDIVTTTFAPANLEPLAQYYWQVVAKGDPFCVPSSTAASEVRSFITAGTCTAPSGFDSSPPTNP